MTETAWTALWEGVTRCDMICGVAGVLIPLGVDMEIYCTGTWSPFLFYHQSATLPCNTLLVNFFLSRNDIGYLWLSQPVDIT